MFILSKKQWLVMATGLVGYMAGLIAAEIEGWGRFGVILVLAIIITILSRKILED